MGKTLTTTKNEKNFCLPPKGPFASYCAYRLFEINTIVLTVSVHDYSL